MEISRTFILSPKPLSKLLEQRHAANRRTSRWWESDLVVAKTQGLVRAGERLLAVQADQLFAAADLVVYLVFADVDFVVPDEGPDEEGGGHF